MTKNHYLSPMRHVEPERSDRDRRQTRRLCGAPRRMLRSINSAWFCCPALAIIGLCWLSSTTVGVWAHGRTEGPAFRAEDEPARSAAIQKRKSSDERLITIRDANLFHNQFIQTCMKALPEDVAVRYAGILAIDDGRPRQRVLDEIGDPLSWAVQKDVVIFSIWISTQRTMQTVATCRIEGRPLFVNVWFVDENRSLDAKLPELGNRSVRELLKNLEKPSPKAKIILREGEKDPPK